MAWDFFAMSTMSIEVIKDDVLQKIYYRVKDRVSISVKVIADNR